MERLKDRPRTLPAVPGVYLFKDKAGKVIYVGKAASLRSRVSSYFAAADSLIPKIRRMMAKAADLDFIVTDSESEAILLECNLIKKYHPRYNVNLKDDKSFPYLKVTLAEDYPRIYVTKRLEQDGSRYFGPYANAGSVRSTMDLIKKLFPYRSCRKKITGNDKRPCLEYHIKELCNQICEPRFQRNGLKKKKIDLIYPGSAVQLYLFYLFSIHVQSDWVQSSVFLLFFL